MTLPGGAAAGGGDEPAPPDPRRTDSVRLPATRTRLVALGDPHGDLLALDLVYEREASEATAFVSVGDNVGYADGVLSSAFCQLLAARGVASVHGNHEDWARDGRLAISAPGGSPCLTPEALAWCRALPYRLRIRGDARPGLRVHVVHSLPGWAYVNREQAPRLLDLEEEAQVVMCGHSHRPAIYACRGDRARARVHRLDPLRDRPLRVELAPGTRYVVDAGSLARPSRPRGGPCEERGTYALLDLANGWLELRTVDKLPRLQAFLAGLSRQPPP